MPDDSDRPLLIDTPTEREKKQETEEKRRENKYRKLQLWFNGILALAAIITFGTVAYQNHVLSESLTEMRKQSKTAEDSVNLARDATNKTLTESRMQTEYARTSSEAAEKATSAAIDAVKVARENFARDQRPWVWLLRTANPTYKEYGGEGRIEWNWHFTNYGKSPA